MAQKLLTTGTPNIWTMRLFLKAQHRWLVDYHNLLGKVQLTQVISLRCCYIDNCMRLSRTQSKKIQTDCRPLWRTAMSLLISESGDRCWCISSKHFGIPPEDPVKNLLYGLESRPIKTGGGLLLNIVKNKQPNVQNNLKLHKITKMHTKCTQILVQQRLQRMKINKLFQFLSRKHSLSLILFFHKTAVNLHMWWIVPAAN